jgi:hypothetical protein
LFKARKDLLENPNTKTNNMISREDSKPNTGIMQGYFTHKTEGPVYICMVYNGHPSDKNAEPGRWYKFQSQEGTKPYGMCQESDLSERITPKDSWGPAWLIDYKKNTGTFKND